MKDEREWNQEHGDELRAERAATASPMTHLSNYLGPIAKMSAGWVVANAERIGVEVNKPRMNEWLKTVAAYQKDIREVMADERIPLIERQKLAAEMRENLTAIRIERYGA